MEGTRKPEEQFYLKLLDRLKLNPEEVVFLDDFGQNLKTAQKMGFCTIKVHAYGTCAEQSDKLIGSGKCSVLGPSSPTSKVKLTVYYNPDPLD